MPRDGVDEASAAYWGYVDAENRHAASLRTTPPLLREWSSNAFSRTIKASGIVEAILRVEKDYCSVPSAIFPENSTTAELPNPERRPEEVLTASCRRGLIRLSQRLLAGL